ncbi:hypothetical protein EG329_006378 [Mollisiaceae sp. DMI_Dod_QoI]|nr:hypothetical protein EG329_006378 [Helotiales sp. DMI_Dod_QoI]
MVFDRMEVHPMLVDPLVGAAIGLGPMHEGGKKQTVSDYVNDLDADSMTGNWTPAGAWHRIHGDGKSTTGGKWHMETMNTSKGTYKVKIVEDGTTLETLEYDSEPSFSTLVDDMQSALG